MPYLTAASTLPVPSPQPVAQAAHDLRNLLATIGLHLETLQRLSGPAGTKAADAAHALLSRGSTLCNNALERAARSDSRRRASDVVATAREVLDLLAPSAPPGFAFQLSPGGAISALADPDEVFRIVFNLVANAVGVANRKPRAISTLTIKARSEGSVVSVQITDDGPGLPAGVRSGLFGTGSRRAAHHGHGLAISRALAERNGGSLGVSTSAKGTTFTLTLPAFVSMIRQENRESRSARNSPFRPAAAAALPERS